MKRLFLMAVMVVCAFAIFAQTLDYPIVKINGKNYYSYTVEPKDGLFAIARKFGVTQADLHACNPHLTDGLKIGQNILVPVADTAVKQDVVVHEVQSKETLYALSRKYNVSIEQIVRQNPELVDGLKVGQRLRIPKMAAENDKKVQLDENQNTATVATPTAQRKHVVRPKETLYGISRLYGTSVEELVELNGIVGAIKVGDELLIPIAGQEPNAANREHAGIMPADTTPLIDSAALVAGQTIVPEKQPVVLPPNALKVAVLMPFMLKTPYIDSSVNYFWEFYRGMLIGLENVKRLGISVELHVYDTEKSLEMLDSVLHNPELADMDLIIGPAYTNQVALVADFAKQHHIYMVVPFTSKVENANEYVLQFNPSQEKILPFVAQTIAKRFSAQNIVIARVSDKRDKANLLADELTKILHKSRKPYKEIWLSADNVDTLRTVIGRNRTLLLIATPHAEVVAPLLPRIKELSLPFLQIWGFEDWKQWISYIDGTYYHSLFCRRNTDTYEQAYATWFGEHTVETEPHYDLIGYDVMNYMAAVIDTNRKNPPAAFGKVACECLQTDFNFEKGTEGQWINVSWHLFGYYNQKLNEIK